MHLMYSVDYSKNIQVFFLSFHGICLYDYLLYKYCYYVLDYYEGGGRSE